MRYLIFSIAFVSWGCTPFEEPVLDGIPPAWTQVDQRLSSVPQMGLITAEIAGQTQRWITADLSVGAINSSAWIGQTPEGPSVSVLGYAPDDEALTGANRIVLSFQLASLQDERPAIQGFALVADLAQGVQKRDSLGADVTSWILTEPDDLDLQGYLSATVHGQFCDAASDTAPIDPATCQDVQITIETILDFREF